MKKIFSPLTIRFKSRGRNKKRRRPASDLRVQWPKQKKKDAKKNKICSQCKKKKNEHVGEGFCSQFVDK